MISQLLQAASKPFKREKIGKDSNKKENKRVEGNKKKTDFPFNIISSPFAGEKNKKLPVRVRIFQHRFHKSRHIYTCMSGFMKVVQKNAISP